MNNLLLLQSRILVPGFFLAFSGFFINLPARLLHTDSAQDAVTNETPSTPSALTGARITSGIEPGEETAGPDYDTGFTLFPNPAPGGQLTLKFSSISAGNLDVKIFNLVGKEMFSQTIRVTAKGEFTGNIELPQSLPSGAYLVKTDLNNSTCTRMLTLRKGA